MYVDAAKLSSNVVYIYTCIFVWRGKKSIYERPAEVILFYFILFV